VSISSLARDVADRGRREADAYRQDTDDERPLSGYLAAMSIYGAGVAAIAGVAALTGRRAPESVSPWDVALIGLATHKLARVLAKDAVTSPLRAAFTKYEEPSGDAELHEETRFHGGPRHAVGELITCPFCLAQWVATGFSAGLVFAPRVTRLAAGTMAGVAMSDYLQLAYAGLQGAVEG
jgi:hypothetical protein